MTPQETNLSPCPYCGPKCLVGFGFCHCGCGEKTNIALKTQTRKGWIRGLPVRRIVGHGHRNYRVDFSDAAPFKMDGVYCKLIQLTKGFYAIVWESDFERINRFRWYAWRGQTGNMYAARTVTLDDGTSTAIPMHREIMNAINEKQIDHAFLETLDNRQCVLRPATAAEQQYNTRPKRNNKTGYKGVREHRPGRFVASIVIGGIRIYLGTRGSAKEAYELYKEAALKAFGEFARV